MRHLEEIPFIEKLKTLNLLACQCYWLSSTIAAPTGLRLAWWDMELPAKSWDPGNGDWSPNCDVSFSPAGITILVELAGLRSADIDITCESNRLQIQGNRQRPEAGRVISPSSGEVKFGRFHVVFDFPAGYNVTQSQAYYLNGFLRIEVPAAEGTGRVVF